MYTKDKTSGLRLNSRGQGSSPGRGHPHCYGEGPASGHLDPTHIVLHTALPLMARCSCAFHLLPHNTKIEEQVFTARRLHRGLCLMREGGNWATAPALHNNQNEFMLRRAQRCMHAVHRAHSVPLPPSLPGELP